jgi:predicted acetyltransferase
MRENVFLVEPNLEYKEQFAAMVQAYKDSGEASYYDMYKEALEDFDKYVLKLQNHAKGIDIPEDWVTTHTFWLTNNEGMLLGVTRVRPSSDNEFVRSYAGNIGYDISPLHRQKGYGIAILKLALKKAKSLGLDKNLITCNYDNVGSIKIIESNGGIFESEVFCESKNTLLRRYWIVL